MTYNKSEIFKTAWTLYKTGNHNTFSEALKASWQIAKSAPTEVTVNELHTGDTVEIEYGEWGNWITCTITEILDTLVYGRYHSVTAVRRDGRALSFAMKPNEGIKRVATAA